MSIEYYIKFNKGKFAGTHQLVKVDLEDLEIDGLASYLIAIGYLTTYTNDGEYEVKAKSYKIH